MWVLIVGRCEGFDIREGCRRGNLGSRPYQCVNLRWERTGISFRPITQRDFKLKKYYH